MIYAQQRGKIDFVVTIEEVVSFIGIHILSGYTPVPYGGGGGGTTRPLPRDGGAEELRGDPTVGPHPKVWTIDRE